MNKKNFGSYATIPGANMKNFAYSFPNMRVGKFLLKKNEVIPIHIHPQQYAMAYLLSGRAEITTYDILSQEDSEYQLKVESVAVKSGDDCQILTPTKNGHKIKAIEDTWFLDVFAPGKEEGILSTYLQIINEADGVIYAKSIPFEEAKLPSSLIENNLSPERVA